MNLDPKSLQMSFYQYLIDPIENGFEKKRILKQIQNPHGFDSVNAEKRLKIYYDAYRSRLLECLEVDFSSLARLMGPDCFKQMTQAYRIQHPSQHFSIRYFGQHLSAFLKTTLPYSQYGFFSEMAAFEWARGETFDAEDAEILTPTALETYPLAQLPSLCLKFHPSVRSLDCSWDTPKLISAIERGEAFREPIQLPKAVRWILWRKGLECVYRSCALEEAFAFTCMQKGMLFSFLCEELCQYKNEREVPRMAIQFVLKWLSEGLVSSLYTMDKKV